MNSETLKKLVVLLLAVVMTGCPWAYKHKPPPSPRATAGVINISSSVGLTWNTQSDATSFNIYRGPSGGPYTQIKTGVSCCTYLDSTVGPHQTICYVITGVNGNGEGPQSTQQCVTLL
jgi:hypothetical protein